MTLEQKIAHGRYLSMIMGCNDCHTPGALYGAPDTTRTLAGSELLWNDPSSRHPVMRDAASRIIIIRSQRRRTWQGASTTNHSAIRGLLRLPGAEPHDRAPSGESAV
jgi:hypothetical protein